MHKLSRNASDAGTVMPSDNNAPGHDAIRNPKTIATAEADMVHTIGLFAISIEFTATNARPRTATGTDNIATGIKMGEHTLEKPHAISQAAITRMIKFTLKRLLAMDHTYHINGRPPATSRHRGSLNRHLKLSSPRA